MGINAPNLDFNNFAANFANITSLTNNNIGGSNINEANENDAGLFINATNNNIGGLDMTLSNSNIRGENINQTNKNYGWSL